MSVRNILRVGLVALLLSLCAAPPAPSLAQGGANRAAVVFRLGSGQIVVRVVSFDGASIEGLALVQAGGLPVVSWSNLVCKIGPQGCDAPSTYDECFCQCTSQSGKCEFWRYFHWREGQWQFSGAGAAEYEVPPDGIEGWAWGDNAARPPEIEPHAIWDARRVAPGLAQAAVVSHTLRVQIDVQGDENHNAQAAARYRRAGDAWSAAISLSRADGALNGAWPAPASPGLYEISVAISDPDGINGSAAITETVQIAGAERILLPMLLARPASK